jgi:hypothetical protein
LDGGGSLCEPGEDANIGMVATRMRDN